MPTREAMAPVVALALLVSDGASIQYRKLLKALYLCNIKCSYDVTKYRAQKADAR